MKKLLLSLIAFTAIFSSCGDEECTLTELDEIIIGDWLVNEAQITFQADGTLIDEQNTFSTAINGIELLDKSYTLEGDSLLIIRSANENPPASSTNEFIILDYECDLIETEFIIPFTFTKI